MDEQLFEGSLAFEKPSTDILSSLSGLEILSQGKSVSSSLLKQFIQSGSFHTNYTCLEFHSKNLHSFPFSFCFSTSQMPVSWSFFSCREIFWETPRTQLCELVFSFCFSLLLSSFSFFVVRGWTCLLSELDSSSLVAIWPMMNLVSYSWLVSPWHL